MQSPSKDHFVSPSMRSTLVIDDDYIHIMLSIRIHEGKTQRFDRTVQLRHSIVGQITVVIPYLFALGSLCYSIILLPFLSVRR